MRLAIALLTASLLAGCNTTGGPRGDADGEPARPKMVFDSLPKQYAPSNQAIGDEGDVADHRARGLGLVDIPALSKYLNDILARIKREAQLEDAPGRVYITASGDPDAQASADGNIYVSFGMLKSIDTEDEVVALLSHEFGHVALGHHDSDVWGNFQKQIQTAYGMTSQLQSNVKAGQANAQLGGRQTSNLQKLQLVIELTDKLVHPAWKRHQEEQADRLAIDMSTRMGYSFGRGQKSLLEKLATLEETVQKEKEESFKKRMDEQAKAGKIDLGAAMQHAFGQLLDDVSRTHEAGSKRIASAAAYHESLYDDLPRPKPHVQPWEKVMQTPAVKSVINNYRLADDASLALLRNEPQKALALAQQATKAPTGEHPYTLMVLAKAQDAAGDQKGYQQTTAKVAKLPEPVWSLYEMQAEIELQHGRPAQAQQIMEEGYARFGGAPTLRPKMIGFYNRINRKDKASAMALDCSFKTPMQRDSCMKAGGFIGNHGRANAPGQNKRS